MGLNFEYIPGQTPIEEEEKEELLISSITTRSELDEFEQFNISQAVEWTLSRKFETYYVLSEWFVRELHRRMFNDVWGWAGTFRKSNKNIGVDKTQIAVSLNQLLENVRYWIEYSTYPQDEIVIRASHQLVSVHCCANGNGRHSRLMADVIITHIFHKPVFTWGQSNLTEHSETRKKYISAIHEADNGNIKPLIESARS